ncbi:AbgT family transporter [Tepidibacter hydrothermalis]|uniref:AbgT family transporter n=1 Tax=Tepidibacter hydrothermalis TaxID=3036126 RepID=A0ABY8EC95_9FIRM|nr:AbgT family transporter [Tepidibacter hydrothermalis]WFD10538.1 AbgT family transporter [Tepidibacter hydrothermalis]
MEKAQVKNNKLFSRFLNGIEIVGNKLPDPVTLFVILCALIIILSKVLFMANVSVVHPLTQKTVNVVDLMSKDGLRGILTGIVGNFQGFPPLGLVLVVMLGAGVAEKSGLMESALKNSISKVPKSLITGMIIFAGILANAAGDAGFIVLPPLAAIVFLGIGRHPLIGMFAAYAGVAGGFSANVMVSMIDVLLAGFTIPAAQMIDPSYQATPAMNFYFLLASTIVILIASVIITEKIIAPRFDKYEGDSDSEAVSEITEDEKKGLKWAGISLFLIVAILVGLCIGDNAFMKDPETNSLLASKAPLMKGLVPIITLIFFIPGLVYGKVTKRIKNDKDVVTMMGQSMSEMGMYIVLAFAASQFLALFTISNIGVIISVKGAESLKNMGFTGFGLIIGFIILSGFINIFVGSASAKWAIMAPVFVPMFLLLDYNPAVTQVAYRIGDSITNPISPLFPYFPIILAFARKYDKEAGMGTIIANMLPYSIVYGIIWIILMVVFMQFNIPLGPGAGIYL